jgi:hypothetical protein
MALVGNISGSGGISNTIGITGSLIIANPGLAAFPSFPGADTVFFVSGAIDGKAAGSRTVSVFGGDVVASGSITVGTGSVTITSNEIRFLGGVAKITSSSAGLTFFDSNNTGGKSLTELAAGGGGGTGTNFFYDTDGDAQVYTTGSVAFVGGGADYANNIFSPADKGTDLFFYVSGSTGGTNKALFGGNVVTSGSLQVIGNEISGSAGGNILLGAAGAVTVAGDLTVNGNIVADANEAKSIFSAVTSNTITIGAGGSTVAADTLSVGGGYGSTGATISSDGNIQANGNLTVDGTSTLTGKVTIAGDLTVNGTTTTVNTDNLVVKDQLIYIASSSVAGTVTYGGLAIASGSGTTNQALVFVKDGTGATSLWSAGRQDVNSGSVTTNAGLTYMPVRASSFEMGGTPGSAVTADSAYVSSSDAQNVLVNHKSSTTFTKSGTAIVQIADFGGDGMITGNSSPSTISSLWVSGTTVNMAHTLAAAVGPVPHGIKIVGGGLEGGSLRISGSPGNTVLNINSHDGGNNSKSLVLSGSAVTANAAISNSTNGVLIQGAGTSLARIYGNATNGNIDFSASNATTLSALATSSTAELTLTGSNINLGHGSEVGKAITLQRGGSKYGSIQYTTSGPTTYAQFGNESGATAVRIGSTGNLNLSGSLVEVVASAGANFFTSTSGASVYLTVSSGSYVTPAGTIGNVAKIESPTGNSILLGSQGTSVVSGSSVRFNVAGPSTVAMQSHGTTFLTFASGSGTDNSVTIAPVNATTANLLNTVATTVNFAGAATTLEIGAATGTTSVNNNLTVDGTTTLGNATTDDITFTGYAASSLIPKTTNQFDLGTPDLRWRNMYTGDLHLKNERGDWTVIEEEDFLTLTNNKSGKRYKFVLEEI